MAIMVECQQCKNKAEVPNTAAGAKGKCRTCGAVIHVPTTGRKVCNGCGADVARAKRWKDEAGQYYCNACWHARMPSLNDLDALCPTETSDVPLLRCGICGVECPETHLTKLGRKNLCVSCHMAERKKLEQNNVIRSETMNTTAPVRARRVGDNEVIISAPLQTAFVQVVAAIEKLGKVKRRDQASHFVEGRIKFGLQSVKVRVSMVERDVGKTTAVIQGSSDDVWGAGAKNATKRLVEVLENLDNPGFKPDRLGIHPLALVAIIIGFFVVIFVIVQKL